jgi:hypothetical protein
MLENINPGKDALKEDTYVKKSLFFCAPIAPKKISLQKSSKSCNSPWY